MKIIKKNVYYCEYCKKKGLSAYHVKKHEDSCTANPDRKCRLCETTIDIKAYVETLKARFTLELVECDHDDDTWNEYEAKWIGEPITLDEIIEYTDGCPNCILAVLRQTKLNYSVFGFKYDYKKEIAEWWSAINKEQYERDFHGI